ncbi:MAG TPA: multicopper oxidase family protein [Candidatus Nanoarchaeia archaeon]|nr:multicopper oxidase family protein [Candidatus Nanoarchaeia archaeon]
MVQSRKTSEAKPIDRTVSGLSESKQSEIVELNDKQILQLKAMPVVKEINGVKIKMYGYNGQIPGPLIKVRQGSTIYVNFTNNIELDSTVHWHGIRLENKYDGVPDVTQSPVKPGESFLYKLDFPDEGIYWYHPHIREDIQQDLGLYGNILVEPKNENYYNKVDKEVALFLDDLRMAKNDIVGFDSNRATFTFMGRFGNTMLLNGQTDYNLNVKKNEVVRFYLTDSANTRVFNFLIENHKLKLVGSDSGKSENEYFADSVIISPGERYVAEVLFDKAGEYKILHKTSFGIETLGTITVSDSTSTTNFGFRELKSNEAMKNELANFKDYTSKEPDYKLELTLDQNMMSGMRSGMMASNEPIEWEETGHMAMMNSMSDDENVKWIIRDMKTGMKNEEIDYKVKVGDIKKIRLYNNPDSMHPMQHPIHLHGQRFLVLSEDDKANGNLAWKDTVLVPSGKTVDILVDFTNPGEWMLHCHIAEHLEAGMMIQFTVSQR